MRSGTFYGLRKGWKGLEGWSMKFLGAALGGVLVLAGCTGHSAAGAASAEDLAGTYVNRVSDGKNYLMLSRDGRGVLVSEESTGSFRMLMTFDWKVDGDKFHQTRVRWTTDGRISQLSHDDTTTYRFNGHALETRAIKTGEWIRWEPTDPGVFSDITEAVSAKFSQKAGS